MSARGPRRSRAAAGLSVLAALLATGSAAAQTSTAEPSRFNFTGYVQPQYEIRRRDGKTSDRVLFRRLVLGLDTTVAGPWTTQLQIDFGPIATSHDERLVVKDAYLRYEGPAASGITVTIGNQKVPFSRTLLASSSRRGLVERPVTGDRSLGSPGRAPGVFAAGWHRRRSIHWTAGAAYSQQSPDAQEVRVDGPAERQSDWI